MYGLWHDSEMRAVTDKARVDFEQMFRSVPAPYVVVFPDAPDYRIAEVNEAYLHATGKRRKDVIGRPLFDAFSPNPDDPTTTGIVNIRRSLDTVLRTGRVHAIPVQRYELPGPDQEFEEHYWKLVSAPIFDSEGHVTHISHRAEDVGAHRRGQRHGHRCGQGTGLGLSMVFGIVKQHGGYIWANSRPGQGTAMRLYWPAVPSLQSPELEEAGDEVRSDASRPRKHATILVVEDEAAVRQLVVRSLEAAGFTVLEAEDGTAGLRMIRGDDGRVADLLLTDAVVPHISGRQLGETAAEIEPDLPVLFISGYAGDETVLRRLVPEGAAFLQKPFTPDQLVRSVSRLLARRER